MTVLRWLFTAALVAVVVELVVACAVTAVDTIHERRGRSTKTRRRAAR